MTTLCSDIYSDIYSVYSDVYNESIYEQPQEHPQLQEQSQETLRETPSQEQISRTPTYKTIGTNTESMSLLKRLRRFISSKKNEKKTKV